MHVNLRLVAGGNRRLHVTRVLGAWMWRYSHFLVKEQKLLHVNA